MSKITNDSITPCGTECFTAVTMWQHIEHQRVKWSKQALLCCIYTCPDLLWTC